MRGRKCHDVAGAAFLNQSCFFFSFLPGRRFWSARVDPSGRHGCAKMCLSITSRNFDDNLALFSPDERFYETVITSLNSSGLPASVRMEESSSLITRSVSLKPPQANKLLRSSFETNIGLSFIFVNGADRGGGETTRISEIHESIICGSGNFEKHPTHSFSFDFMTMLVLSRPLSLAQPPAADSTHSSVACIVHDTKAFLISHPVERLKESKRTGEVISDFPAHFFVTRARTRSPACLLGTHAQAGSAEENSPRSRNVKCSLTHTFAAVFVRPPQRMFVCRYPPG